MGVRREILVEGTPPGERERTVADVLGSHPNQWILLATTQTTEDGEPIAGYLIANAKSRNAISSRMRELTALPQDATGVSLFYANRASVPSSVAAAL